VAEDLQIQNGVIIPGHELELKASLSGGPGGQHVNKTHSRITLRWHLDSSQALSERQRSYLAMRIANRITNAGFVVVHCGTYRQQRRNIQGARQLLKELIYTGLQRPKKRRPTRPTRSSQRKRVARKKKRGELKQNRRKPGAGQ
jgi:ribosome-associated protein